MKVQTISSRHWLDIAEITTVLASIGGSVASLLLEQFLWVTIPLSTSVALGLINRQRLRRTLESELLNKQVEIAALVEKNKQQIEKNKYKYKQKNRDLQTELAEVTDDLGQLRNLVTTELFDLQKIERENSQNTIKNIEDVRHSLSEINVFTEGIESNLKRLNKRQKATSQLVRELKAIDVFSQSIKAGVNVAQSYFERGFAYQRLGNKNRAIEDYTKAIELASDRPQTYHNRGLLYLELNINQKAILDLRKASQLYFDRANLEKYRETRDLSQKIHQQMDELQALEEIEVKQDNSQEVLVGSLFD